MMRIRADRVNREHSLSTCDCVEAVALARDYSREAVVESISWPESPDPSSLRRK
jgi:hypothetical protein